MLKTLTRIFPRKIADYEAKLTGVGGFTGRGEVAFSAWTSGAKNLEVALRGVAGRVAEIFVDGGFVATIDLDNGRANQVFDTRRGNTLPSFVEGGRVEIRQNGDVILEGVLIHD